MSAPVADRSSNKNEQIVHAAEVIGRSEHRAAIFRAVYTGKTRAKSVVTLMSVTGLQRTRVLDAGKALYDNDIVGQTKIEGVTAYTKIEFFQRYRNRILKLAKNEKARAAVPTKRNARGTTKTVQMKFDVVVPKARISAERISVDDIESFSKVRAISDEQEFVRMAETKFKNGVAKLLGEKATFKDWGGESRDLSSTRLRMRNSRKSVAFAFKGPGKSGKLTPGKMGKNGDQILQLSRCPAEMFLIQYWAEIDDSVLEMLEKLIQLRSFFEKRKLWYGVIDGQDSARLIKAYPNVFATKKGE